jgi:hypothetical protein
MAGGNRMTVLKDGLGEHLALPDDLVTGSVIG